MKKYNNPKERVIGKLLMDCYSNVRRHKKKSKGLDCSLTFEQIHSLFERNDWKCNVTGIPFLITDKPLKRWESDKMGFNRLLMPSVDRIDSSKGYHIDNIQIVIQFYNLGKTDNEDSKGREIIELIYQNKPVSK